MCRRLEESKPMGCTNPAAQTQGDKIRWILVQEQHEVAKVHAISTSVCEPFDEGWLQGVRCWFRVAMGLPEQEVYRMRPRDSITILDARWFPSGIECPVDSCGIFSITAEDTPAVAKKSNF